MVYTAGQNRNASVDSLASPDSIYSDSPDSIPHKLTFTDHKERAEVTFGTFSGTEKAQQQISAALHNQPRSNVTIRQIGKTDKRLMAIEFRVKAEGMERYREKEVLVSLTVNADGKVTTCALKNPRSLFPLTLGKFAENDRRADKEGFAGLSLSELRKQWNEHQNAIRQPFADQHLIRKDVTADTGNSAFAIPDYFSDLKPKQRNGVEDNAELLHEAEWLHGDKFLSDLFEGHSALGDNIECKNLKWLGIPAHLKELGNNITANKLRRLDFHYETTFKAGEQQWKGGEIRRIGNNFSSTSLQSINLNIQAHFTDFGRNFSAPNLVHLSLRDAKSFQGFASDMNIPALRVLDLTGAENFRAFPADFFDKCPHLRSLELRGTGVRFEDLPERLQEDHDIHIDIRPAAAGQLHGRQNTHQQTVHFSSSQSARRIHDKFKDNMLDVQYQEMKGYLLAQPATPVPQGLETHLTSDLNNLVRYIHTLDKQHPHRQYFTQPAEAAKRAMNGRFA